MQNIERKIAYFSMEIALDARVPTYSGGLGVLAGDTIRSAADLKLPMVAVSLLSFRSVAYPQQCFDLWRFRSDFNSMAGALPGSAGQYFGNNRSLCLRASSAVRRLHSDYAGVFVPVAHAHHARHVSDPGDDVC